MTPTTVFINESPTNRFSFAVDRRSGASSHVRIQPAIATTSRRSSTGLLGPLNRRWVIVQPLQLTIEQDSDGWFIVSDDIFLVYGDGPSLPEAWEDYRVSLTEYCELVRADANTSVSTRAQYAQLRTIIQPCDVTGDAPTRVPRRSLPPMTEQELQEAYAKMANDAEYEQEALEWIEAFVGETLE